MIARVARLLVWLVALSFPADLLAGDRRPQTILVLDQSDTHGPFYSEVFTALRTAVQNDAQGHVTIYAESLDLSRFYGEAYESSLRQLLKEKYRDKPIGVLVAVGSAALERVLGWRARS